MPTLYLEIWRNNIARILQKLDMMLTDVVVIKVGIPMDATWENGSEQLP